MADTKGNIRARKLGNTGITEDILTKIANAKGGTILAVVELKADEIKEKTDGDDRTVDFLLETIEPVVDGKLNGILVGHVRDIHAALQRNRLLAENGPQLPLDGAPQAPTNKEVLDHGKGILEYDDQGPKLADPFTVPDPASDDPWEYPAPEGTGTSPTAADQAEPAPQPA